VALRKKKLDCINFVFSVCIEFELEIEYFFTFKFGCWKIHFQMC
jgi:hypothetical protein